MQEIARKTNRRRSLLGPEKTASRCFHPETDVCGRGPPRSPASGIPAVPGPWVLLLGPPGGCPGWVSSPLLPPDSASGNPQGCTLQREAAPAPGMVLGSITGFAAHCRAVPQETCFNWAQRSNEMCFTGLPAICCTYSQGS